VNKYLDLFPNQIGTPIKRKVDSMYIELWDGMIIRKHVVESIDYESGGNTLIVKQRYSNDLVKCFETYVEAQKQYNKIKAQLIEVDQ